MAPDTVPYIQAVLLGIVQGVTEFLPISSDGHVAISQLLFGNTADNIFFLIMLHGASMLAVFSFFWRRILKLTLQDCVHLAVGTIPVAIAGIALQPFLNQLSTTAWVIGLCLLITGVFNLYTDYRLKKQNVRTQAGMFDALLIGTAQIFALLPGLSRSATTIASGLSRGLSRQTAFEFAFLLSIPAILGALALELLPIVQGELTVAELSVNPLLNPGPLAAGLLATFLSGLASLRLLQYVVSQARFAFFGWYCFLAGVFVIIFL